MQLLSAEWCNPYYVENHKHIELIREMMSYHCLCPTCCPFYLNMATGELSQAGVNSALHWSRSFEWPWALLNGELDKDIVCLDAAGGHGVFQQALAKRCKRVVNVDKNEESLRAAATLAMQLKQTRIEMRVGNLLSIPTEDKYFDRVFCLSVVEHIANWRDVISELIRVLKPGGLLLLTMDVVRSDLSTVQSDGEFFIGQKEAEEICARFGGIMPDWKGVMANRIVNGLVISVLAIKVRK